MLAFLHWLARRPLRLLHALGGFLGWLAWGLSPSYRRRLDEHAALAGVSAPQRRRAVTEAGRMVGEVPWLWLRPPQEPIGPWVAWDGEPWIEQALGTGHGLLILTPHLGCFEVCAQAYAERFGGRQPVTVLYRPARKAWLRELEETARARPGLATAPASLAGVRQMLRALRRGETVGLLPDQVPPEGLGVWAPFFGRPAYTMTLAARLVQQSGAALLLMWGERLPAGQGWRVHVRPAPPLPSRDGDEAAWQLACATTINRAMEALIAERPEQYLWGYNRYKTPRKELA
jgi:KDO2-lipid IV(A) lauroyltransferase